MNQAALETVKSILNRFRKDIPTEYVYFTINSKNEVWAFMTKPSFNITDHVWYESLYDLGYYCGKIFGYEDFIGPICLSSWELSMKSECHDNKELALSLLKGYISSITTYDKTITKHYKYITIDEEGYIFAFKVKPIFSNGKWLSDSAEDKLFISQISVSTLGSWRFKINERIKFVKDQESKLDEDAFEPIFIHGGNLSSIFSFRMNEIYFKRIYKSRGKSGFTLHARVILVCEYLPKYSTTIQTFNLYLTDEEYKRWKDEKKGLDKFYYQIDEDDNIKIFKNKMVQIEPIDCKYVK